jgi:hypothetical protein
MAKGSQGRCTCDAQDIVQRQLYGQLVAAHVQVGVGPVPAESAGQIEYTADRVVYEVLGVCSVSYNSSTWRVTSDDCHAAHHRSGPRLIQYPPGLKMRYNTSIYSCRCPRRIGQLLMHQQWQCM